MAYLATVHIIVCYSNFGIIFICNLSQKYKALLFHQSYLLNYMYMKFTHAYNLHISITSVPEISYVFASCVSVLKNYISSPRMTIILHGEF